MDRAADTWTLSRVIAAGEALARVDGERAQTGAGKGASEGVKGRGFALVPGPLVGLVTNREPTRAVHCKGSGETVPCTRLTLADDTRNDVHAVLWRTHAGLDVGARSSPTLRIRRFRAPLFLQPSLTTLPIRHAAGPGDLVAFKSVRVRWNTWNERAEACTGWASDVEVLARATDVLGRTMGLFQPRGANVWGANVYVDAGRVEALRAWARREHAQLLEIAADAQLGPASPTRASLGAGVRACAAGWLLNSPEAERVRAVHFVGRCVAVSRAPSSTGVRASRPVVWLSQGTGECVEATLPPEEAAGPSEDGEEDGEEDDCRDGFKGKFEGKVLELTHARVRVLHSTGRRCLVATRPAVEVDPSTDQRAQEILARCPVAHASVRYASVGDLLSAPRADAPVARFTARVSWIALPRIGVPGGGRGRIKGDRSAVTRDDVASSLLAYGCVGCGRTLEPDPLDSVYRQCECHSGTTDATGYVWRGITLGLTDDMGGPGDGSEGECENEPPCLSGKRRRVRTRGTVEARLDDSELVSRLLLGVTPGDAAWSREAEGCSGSEIDHLAVAAAAINALALGGMKNSPMEWRVRTPRLDENGVPKPGPMEVLGFSAAHGG